MDQTSAPAEVGSIDGLGGSVPPLVDFDIRTNTWGHAIYGIGPNDDGTWRVSGCLTPLPKVGQHAAVSSGQILRFREVKPMGNPRDGFHAVVEATSWALPLNDGVER